MRDPSGVVRARLAFDASTDSPVLELLDQHGNQQAVLCAGDGGSDLLLLAKSPGKHIWLSTSKLAVANRKKSTDHCAAPISRRT